MISWKSTKKNCFGENGPVWTFSLKLLNVIDHQTYFLKQFNFDRHPRAKISAEFCALQNFKLSQKPFFC